MKKILYITTNSPLHPRTEMVRGFLSEAYHVNVFSLENERLIYKLFTLLNGRNFFISAFFHKELLKGYDIILMQNSHVMPLILFARLYNKRVILDLTDDNPLLNEYNLKIKYPFFSLYFKFVSCFSTVIEKLLIKKYVDSLLVNSKYLYEKYETKKKFILYYSSPFHKIQFKNNTNKNIALIYLGMFYAEKGSTEIIHLANYLGVPLYVIGDINESARNEIYGNTNIIHYEKMSSKNLFATLLTLVEKYCLLGTSIIKTNNPSYAVQEANKDIDYLALGFPIIGNHRMCTKEKIDKGAGWYYDDPNLKNILLDKQNISSAIHVCHQLQKAYYSQYTFRDILFNSIGDNL